MTQSLKSCAKHLAPLTRKRCKVVHAQSQTSEFWTLFACLLCSSNPLIKDMQHKGPPQKNHTGLESVFKFLHFIVWRQNVNNAHEIDGPGSRDGVFPHVPAMFQAGRNLTMESKPMWHPKTGWPGSFQFMSHHHRTKQFNQHHQQKQSLLSLFLIVVFFWHLYTLHFNQHKDAPGIFGTFFFAALLSAPSIFWQQTRCLDFASQCLGSCIEALDFFGKWSSLFGNDT